MNTITAQKVQCLDTGATIVLQKEFGRDILLWCFSKKLNFS